MESDALPALLVAVSSTVPVLPSAPEVENGAETCRLSCAGIAAEPGLGVQVAAAP